MTAASPFQSFAEYLGVTDPVAADVVLVAVAVLVGLGVDVLLTRLIKHLLRRERWELDERFFRRLGWATRLLLPLVAIQVVASELDTLLWDAGSLPRRLLTLGLIGSVVYLITVVLGGVEYHIKTTHPTNVPDNYIARKLHTQLTVLKRSIMTLVLVVAFGLALMTIPVVRELGVSLLASAGFAGLVIGLAARPMIENLIAGVQIALTQPINIDDVVIIADQWGWVEEITATYVVVRIWDERRLVVPFSKFLQEPFQNWTRRNSRILGTVFIHTDYSMPVQPLRDELKRILEATELWDKRVCVLQVTDATERTMQVRALVSAADSPKAWDLRVHVREKLIAFMQAHYPQHLPRTRVELPDPTDPVMHQSVTGQRPAPPTGA